ncbi:MAG: ribonuclease III [bacterium]
MTISPIFDKLQDQIPQLQSYVASLGIVLPGKIDQELFLQTFIHKSFAADYKDSEFHNERLEFVGDGILGASINKLLFLDNPHMPESNLTLYKIALVREEILAEVARDILLNEKLFISKGEEKTQGRKKDSILSDGLEALIGFVYIQCGASSAEDFIKTHIYSKKEGLQETNIKSYKTKIQELIQKQHKIIPEYKDLEDKIDEKGNVIQYRTEIYINQIKQSEGIGTNKKKAQEDAAKNYYQQIQSSL